ncbi:MAG: sensor histidine kinase [Caldilineaceae bacterium]
MPLNYASRKFFLLKWLDDRGFNVQRQLSFLQWTLPILLFLIVVSDEAYEFIFDDSPLWSKVFAVEVFIFGILGPIVVWFTLDWIKAMWVEREQNHKALRQMYDELTAAQERLKALHGQRGELLNRLMNVQEEERRHLAREIHDELGQLLTGLSLNLKVCQGAIPANLEQAHRYLTKASDLVQLTMEQAHSIIVGLRPTLLDDYGLLPALKEELHQRLEPLGVQVRIETQGTIVQLPADVATTAFRITQEAITNIIRHAQAQHVQLVLRYTRDELIVEIVDDGVGIQAKPLAHVEKSQPLGKINGEAKALPNGRRRLGIVGMQERAAAANGWFQLAQGEPTGAAVRFGLPFGQHDESREAIFADSIFAEIANSLYSAPTNATAQEFSK